jgi:hypothetical protein
VAEIFKNDTEATATNLGTLAFAGNLPADVIATTNIWETDHVFSVIDPPISNDVYDYYRFDPYQLASVRINFTSNSMGDYANLVTVTPVQGVSRIEGHLSGIWTGGEHSNSPYEIAAESFLVNNLNVFKAANPQIDTTAVTWGRDEFPDSEAIWYLTGETVILEIIGFEFDGTSDQIAANGGGSGTGRFSAGNLSSHWLRRRRYTSR